MAGVGVGWRGGVGWGVRGLGCKVHVACLSERANELILVPGLSSGRCFFIYFLFDTQHKPASMLSQLQPPVLVN